MEMEPYYDCGKKPEKIGQVKITFPKENNFKKAYTCNLRGVIIEQERN